jgi:DNA invertase Pin-like site-specific DNA recombinase
MALIGYARVSTARTTSRKAQYVDNQVERLKAADADPVFIDDGKSGKLRSRPEWDKCLAFLRDDDTLVITKLDRIGRSIINLIDVVNLLGQRGIGIQCLDQPIDTTSPNGKLIFHIMSAMAEWEASMAAERTLEGLAAARERHGGKLPIRGPSIKQDQIDGAIRLAQNTTMSAGRIAQMIGVSRATLYRHVDIAKIRQETS